MAFIKLQFKPGVNRDQTDYSNEGGWYACDKIRFRSGYPEKIGGWTDATPGSTYLGVCRNLWNWITSYTDNFMAVGTNEKLYLEVAGSYFNITPFTATFDTPDTNNCIFTTGDTKLITVDLGAVAHGQEDGTYVEISGVVGTGDAIGGIPVSEINGNHKITVLDSYKFTFEVTTTATSTTVSQGGTAIILQFELAPGNPIAINGYGWGTSVWGGSSPVRAWGVGSSQPIALPQTDWWMDNFDNDLVANVRNGAAFWWSRGTTVDPSSALAARAIPLSQYAYDWANASLDPLPYSPTEYQNAVPTKVMQMLVSQQDKHLIAFGSVPFGTTNVDDFDPMLIRWASQDNPENWIPDELSTAGDLRLSRGSQIVRALPTRQEILVWTNSHLYTLQFLGTTDVFGLQEYADNISIASPRAMATAANITYWMGQDKFYAYTGRVETLPCTLRNHVFNNINSDQVDQIVCGTNEQWNEVWWFYPTADSNYNNAYVVYNHLERIWYYGTIDRTAWLDTALRDYPQAANAEISLSGNTVSVGPGYLYNHENGIDANGAPMVSYIQSSDFDLDDGDNFMLTRRILPDIGFNGSTDDQGAVTLQLRPRNFPGGPNSFDAADTQSVIETSIGQYTEQVFVRSRARQMAIKIQSQNLGVQWQLGAPRLDVRPDGRR